MVKEKTSLEGKNVSFKDSDFVQEWDRVSLSTYSKWSWDLVWRKWYAWKYFVIFLIAFVGCILTIIIDMLINAAMWIEWEDMITPFTSILLFLFKIGVLGFSLHIAKWIMQRIGDFFHEITWNRIWKIFLWNIVMKLIVILWLFLLIIPWIFFAVRLNFLMYAVVDKWYWPIDALVYSRNITKWHFWEIVLFDFYFFAINILWMLCIIVGLIWTIPMTSIATAKYYHILSELYKNWSEIKKK